MHNNKTMIFYTANTNSTNKNNTPKLESIGGNNPKKEIKNEYSI